MSKLFKKVKLLVSRHYDHGGDGLERGGLVFFRSIEEYNKLAVRHKWEDGGPSFGTTWCVRPVEVECIIHPKDYAVFQNGGKLPHEKVFFSANNVQLVNSIGGW